MSYGLKCIMQEDTTHILGFKTAQSGGDDALLEVWNGPTASAIVLTINEDGQLQGSDGTALLPNYSYEDDKNTGFYRIGDDNVGLALGGTKIIDFGTTTIAITGNISVTGKSAFGTTPNALIPHQFGGSYTSDGSSSYMIGAAISVNITGAAGDTTLLESCYFGGAIATQTAAETITRVSAVRMGQSVTKNVTTITNADTLYIDSAPTEGTSNAAIRIETGSLVASTTVLATTATAGFFYMPSCAGVPTGVPETHGSALAMVYDSTNDDMYLYDAAWVKVALA